MSAKMQPIKEKTKRLISASLLSSSMWEEESCSILLLKRASFPKKWQGHTSTKWWMVSTLCIARGMPTETSSQRIYYLVGTSHLSSPILASLALFGEKMELAFCTQNWGQKDTWLHRFLARIIEARKPTSLPQGSFFLSCMLETHLLKRHLLTTHTTGW